MSVWFITGASRGFGLEITREALSRGDSVVATARNPQAVQDAIPDGGDRLLAVGLDVGVSEQVSAAVEAAVERFGRIDVLVNNAGRGLVGAVEETSDAEARALFDVNVFGLLAVTRAVLPHMRAARSGSGGEPVLGGRFRRLARLGCVRGDEIRGGGAVGGHDPRIGATGNQVGGHRAGPVSHELP